jgi:hypothetical protein
VLINHQPRFQWKRGFYFLTEGVSMEYVHWLAQVNITLGRLSNHIFTAEDFDYSWIEAHLQDTPPDQAARDARAADGLIVENLPAPAMLIFTDREAIYTQLDSIKEIEEDVETAEVPEQLADGTSDDIPE